MRLIGKRNFDASRSPLAAAPPWRNLEGKLAEMLRNGPK